jgi:hypothetical protein
MKNKRNSRGRACRQAGFAPIIILILLVLVVGGVFYFATKNKSVPSPVASTQPSSSPIVISTPDPATANWKTYTNNQYDFSLKYPSYMTLKNIESGVLLQKAIHIKADKNDPKMYPAWDYTQVVGISVKKVGEISLSDWFENFCKNDDVLKAPDLVAAIKKTMKTGNIDGVDYFRFDYPGAGGFVAQRVVFVYKGNGFQMSIDGLNTSDYPNITVARIVIWHGS